MTDSKAALPALPAFSRKEEWMNSISHMAGAAFGVAALVLCILQCAKKGTLWTISSAVIYGVSLIILYTCSAVYHGLKANNGKRVMRIIDHCTIFVLIAGTYTPYSLIALRKASNVWGWTIFGLVWSISILGIVLNAVNMEKFKVFSMFCYIATGWIIIIAINPLLTVLSGNGFYLLLAGGIAYTIGSILFGIGSKIKYFHFMFHIFVLVGSILHFISIYYYVLPMR